MQVIRQSAIYSVYKEFCNVVEGIDNSDLLLYVIPFFQLFSCSICDFERKNEIPTQQEEKFRENASMHR